MSLPNFARPSPTNGYYDVFLSFRGGDTRKGFTTTLCRYLRQSKIHTFMDDRLLGHEINKLFEMIKKSRMAVVIYSESYASSDWCLQELVKILKRRKKEKQLVLPIFLEVNPSELKNLTGKTQEYLDNHSIIEYGRRTIESWKDALREFGELTGRLCFTDDYRSEYEFIQKIEVAIKKMLRECEQTRQYSAKSSTGAAHLMNLQPSDQDFSRPSRNGYDVFLSFRGEDTRKGFTTNLCQFLRGKKIHTFMDDRPRGQEIDKLFVMIKKSRMAVVIYSESYASSDMCLQELVKILKRWKKEKQLIFPIFLKVNPSKLKHLTVKTQEYLDTHTREHGNRTIQSWKNAVRKIGEVSGLRYTDKDTGSEYEFIEKCVVERINEILAADSEETEGECSINKSSMDATVADLQVKSQVVISSNEKPNYPNHRPRRTKRRVNKKWQPPADEDEDTGTQVAPINLLDLKVNPSELKYLTGKTQEYLDTHIREHGNRTIQSWKDAVRKIGEVSVINYTDYDRWSENEFIEKCVVERINEILAADSEETEEECSINKSSMDATVADLQVKSQVVISSNEKPNYPNQLLVNKKWQPPAGEDEDTGVQVAPIVKLEVVAILDLKARLYQFDKDGGKWIERGVGTVKLLKHKESKKVRLFMKEYKTLKICANHLVLPNMSVQEHAANEKSCVWHTTDGELKEEEIFCIRFASVENNKEFMAKFQEVAESQKAKYRGKQRVGLLCSC